MGNPLKTKKTRAHLIKLSGESSQNDKAKHITVISFSLMFFVLPIFYILATLLKFLYSDSNFSDVDLKNSWSSKVWELNEAFKQALYNS